MMPTFYIVPGKVDRKLIEDDRLPARGQQHSHRLVTGPVPPFHVDLSQQTALVTGAGADIGRAIALALADSGANVVVNDINPDRVERVVAEIEAAGGQALGWQGDITNRFQVGSMIETRPRPVRPYSDSGQRCRSRIADDARCSSWMSGTGGA